MSTSCDQKISPKIALDLYTSHTQRSDEAVQEISITTAWIALEKPFLFNRASLLLNGAALPFSSNDYCGLVTCQILTFQYVLPAQIRSLVHYQVFPDGDVFRSSPAFLWSSYLGSCRESWNNSGAGCTVEKVSQRGLDLDPFFPSKIALY